LILFDASESIAGNPTSRITRFEWQVSDDTSGDGSSLSKIFSVAGSFDVTLAVTNDQNLTHTTTVTIKINEFTGPVELSGKILLSSIQHVDSDVNQYLSDPVSNNSFSAAQYRTIPSVTSGYVNEAGKGPDYTGTGNLTLSGDEYDVFKVTAAGGETVRLIIGDSDADLDLIIYDLNGDVIAYSVQPAGALDEIVRIPSDGGTFYIVVTPWEGASRYALSIDTSTTQSTTSIFSSDVDIIPGDVIVTFKEADFTLQGSGKQLEPFFLEPHLPISNAQRIKKITFGADQANALRSIPNQRPTYDLMLASDPTFLERKLLTCYLAKEMGRDPSIEFSEVNSLSHPQMTIPDDQYYQRQWHYRNINLPAAWDVEKGSSDVIIAVIDSGITKHPDLLDNLTSDGFDFISESSTSGDGDGIDDDPTDPGDGRDNEFCPSTTGSPTSSFHGTHVAGTIAASGNNDLGVTGVSWNSKLMDLRVCGCRGCATYDWLQALLYAAGLPNDSGLTPSQKADIINMSLGGTGFSPGAQDVIQRVRDEGVIIIASSGNDGHRDNPVNYPASYDGVISVGATGPDDQRSFFSSFNDYVDLAAPGGDLGRDSDGDGYPDGVFSTAATIEDGNTKYGYKFKQGTSMAAPHVSGVVALMKSVVDFKPMDLDSLIASGVLAIDMGEEGFDSQYGFGLINGRLAVDEARRVLTGGVIDDTPVLRSSVNEILFGATGSTAQIELRNIGTGDLQVESVSSSTDWMTIASPLSSNGLGVYDISVDREGLEEGVYAAEIEIRSNARSSQLVTIRVRMDVVVESLPDPEAGQMWINFYDVLNGQSNWRYWTRSSGGGNYYSFEGGIELPAGVYVLVAGTDPDNSGTIGETGEALGRFGGVRTPAYVVANKNISNLEFYVPYQQPVNNDTGAQTAAFGGIGGNKPGYCDKSCLNSFKLKALSATQLPSVCSNSDKQGENARLTEILSCD